MTWIELSDTVHRALARPLGSPARRNGFEMYNTTTPPPPTVLLLEDEALIALDIEETLNEMGFCSVEIFSSCADAENWLESGDPAVAIVDPHLRDGECDNVVRHLVARKIPFVVYSGDVKSAGDREPNFKAGRWLSKPSSPEDLSAAVRYALADGTTQH